MRLLPLLCLSLLTLLSSGCIVAAAGAAGGAGYLISRDVRNDYHTARVTNDIDETWASVKETLEILEDLNVEREVLDFPRTVRTKVDGDKVEVIVEAYDIDATLIRVSAKGAIGYDYETAEFVLNEILDRLEE